MDKPWLAVDIPRAIGKTVPTEVRLSIQDKDDLDRTIQVEQTFKCGNVYLAYANFLGQDVDNPHSEILVSRSTNCGATWNKPVKISESLRLNQGVTIAIAPNTGHIYVAWQLFATLGQQLPL